VDIAIEPFKILPSIKAKAKKDLILGRDVIAIGGRIEGFVNVAVYVFCLF
jgi:hypothetical protein